MVCAKQYATALEVPNDNSRCLKLEADSAVRRSQNKTILKDFEQKITVFYNSARDRALALVVLFYFSNSILRTP
jgi:hypothetical protein